MSVLHRPLPKVFLSVALLTLAWSSLVQAQSGSRTRPAAPAQPAGSDTRQPAAGSASRTKKVQIGLQGYCPVCLVEMKQWVQGEPNVAVDYDGRRYLFPGAEQAEMFRKNPLKYVPALGGDDVVLYAQSGKRTAGQLQHGVKHQGRHFFFATPENKQRFLENTTAYQDIDLALGGECIVCRVGMQQRVAGTPEFTTVHRGLRFQFPGPDQMNAFVKSPDAFLEQAGMATGQQASPTTSAPPSATQQPPAGSSTR